MLLPYRHETKQAWSWLVLGWETSWEYRVLEAFSLLLSNSRRRCCLKPFNHFWVLMLFVICCQRDHLFLQQCCLLFVVYWIRCPCGLLVRPPGNGNNVEENIKVKFRMIKMRGEAVWIFILQTSKRFKYQRMTCPASNCSIIFSICSFVVLQRISNRLAVTLWLLWFLSA